MSAFQRSVSSQLSPLSHYVPFFTNNISGLYDLCDSSVLIIIIELISGQAHSDWIGGTSLVVQWLRIRLSNAGDTGSIPGQGIKIPHGAGQLSQHAATTEPACSGAHSPQQRAHTPQGTSHVPQLRPTQPNKLIN